MYRPTLSTFTVGRKQRLLSDREVNILYLCKDAYMYRMHNIYAIYGCIVTLLPVVTFVKNLSSCSLIAINSPTIVSRMIVDGNERDKTCTMSFFQDGLQENVISVNAMLNYISNDFET